MDKRKLFGGIIEKKMKTATAILFFIVLVYLISCREDTENPLPANMDYKQEMRDFVQNISAYAKAINSGFIIIPQNGAELISTTGDDGGIPKTSYISAIDGIGQENLNYGYTADDKKTPNIDNLWIKTFLNMVKNNGNVQVMITDYCSTQSKIDNSYSINHANGYISFAADHRELDNIPIYPASIYNENSDTIMNLQQAKNFLYLINPDNFFASRQKFVDAIKSTNYDCVIMDFFYNKEEFASAQIEELKQKVNGGKRLLICYMSIGEAENYRYYWQNDWAVGNPSFIEKENTDWRGNYFVRYWESKWQNIIFGNDNSYLKKILDAGFDGVYLDIIDAFERYEKLDK